MEKQEFSTNTCNLPPLHYPSLSPPSWKDFQMGELGFLTEQIPSCFLNFNFENSMNQSAPLDSVMSTIASSPPAMSVEKAVLSACCYSTASGSPRTTNPPASNTHQVGENLPILVNLASPRLGFAPLSADPGFAERAANLSCYGSRSSEGFAGQFGFPEPEFPGRSAPGLEVGKLSRASSSQFLKAGPQMSVLEKKEMHLPEGFPADKKSGRSSRPSTPDNVEFSNVREDSSNSSSKCPNEINGRKRRANPKVRAKDLLPSSPSSKDAKEEDSSNSKRCKITESVADGNNGVKPKREEDDGGDAVEDFKKPSKENSKLPEPPKQDYIHVRARRGQATDSHSLAERVRREKISERMKFLQDLVPGCNKVTGKAVMLDEIINYVQSLQRQVEFLSMKLATINPRLDINMDALLSKDLLQSRGIFYPFESSAVAYSYGHHQPHGHQGGQIPSALSHGSDPLASVNPLDDAALDHTLGMQISATDGFVDTSSKLNGLWDDDLQSVVQLGFGQNQEISFQSQSFHGPSPSVLMKNEL